MNEVVQVDTLKYRLDFVITVRTFTQNTQIPIDFGEGRKAEVAGVHSES
jgi:hypothetical protein